MTEEGHSLFTLFKYAEPLLPYPVCQYKSRRHDVNIPPPRRTLLTGMPTEYASGRQVREMAGLCRLSATELGYELPITLH